MSAANTTSSKKHTAAPRSRRVVLVLIAGGIAVLYFLLGGKTGVVELYRVHSEVRALEKQLIDARLSIDSLNGEIRQLKSDTAYMEQIAREKLGMAKKTETIFKFPPEQHRR